MTKKFYAVVNAEGKIFSGVSTLSGRAMWFNMDGDRSEMVDCQALRIKRDARWLAKAIAHDATAKWIEV